MMPQLHTHTAQAVSLANPTRNATGQRAREQESFGNTWSRYLAILMRQVDGKGRHASTRTARRDVAFRRSNGGSRYATITHPSIKDPPRRMATSRTGTGDPAIGPPKFRQEEKRQSKEGSTFGHADDRRGSNITAGTRTAAETENGARFQPRSNALRRSHHHHKNVSSTKTRTNSTTTMCISTIITSGDYTNIQASGNPASAASKNRRTQPGRSF